MPTKCAVQAVIFTGCLLGLIACRAEQGTGPAPTVAADADAWSGDTLVLHSASFVGADTAPAVVVGTVVLAVRFLGGDSIGVDLPDTNAQLALTVYLRSGAAMPLSVRVHGFSAVSDGPLVDGLLYPLLGSTPGALGFQSGRLMRFDFRYGTAAGLTPDTNLSSQCLVGPTPSATSGLVVVAPLLDSAAMVPCGPAVAVPIAPATGPPDTAHLYGSYAMSLVHFGADRWLISEFGYHRLVVGDSVAAVDLCSGKYNRVVLSPMVDRAVLLCPDGPVVDGTVPAEAFLSAQGGLAFGATFTDNGDTLFVANYAAYDSLMLESFDAKTGRALAQTRFPEAAGFIVGLKADPSHRWLYIMVPPSALEVLDRTTLARVATLKVPPAASGSYHPYLSDWTLMVDPIARRLYAVGQELPSFTEHPGGGPTTVVTFDLMP